MQKYVFAFEFVLLILISLSTNEELEKVDP